MQVLEVDIDKQTRQKQANFSSFLNYNLENMNSSFDLKVNIKCRRECCDLIFKKGKMAMKLFHMLKDIEAKESRLRLQKRYWVSSRQEK